MSDRNKLLHNMFDPELNKVEEGTRRTLASTTRRCFLKALSTSVILQSANSFGQSAKTELTPIRFALNRPPYDGTNAPFLLARDKGWFAAAGLDVELSLSKNVADAIRRVASNECDFGYADFSVLISFAAENPDTAPHLLYSIFDSSPAAIVTWKSAGVRSATDLAGKTLSATPGDGPYQLFPAFCRASKLDPKKVKILEVPLEEREKIMHERKVDGAFGFDTTILYKLLEMGDARDAVSFLYYADAGLPLYSNGIIVSRKALTEKRAHIAGLVSACARAWQASLTAPAEMLASLGRANPKADMKLEAERFEWVRSHQIMTANVRKNGMGTIDRGRFEKLVTLLVPQSKPGQLAAIIEDGYLPPIEQRRV
jgi:NitT/TauT family transport system substrate-binding protein